MLLDDLSDAIMEDQFEDRMNTSESGFTDGSKNRGINRMSSMDRSITSVRSQQETQNVYRENMRAAKLRGKLRKHK